LGIKLVQALSACPKVNFWNTQLNMNSVKKGKGKGKERKSIYIPPSFAPRYKLISAASER